MPIVQSLACNSLIAVYSDFNCCQSRSTHIKVSSRISRNINTRIVISPRAGYLRTHRRGLDLISNNDNERRWSRCGAYDWTACNYRRNYRYIVHLRPTSHDTFHHTRLQVRGYPSVSRPISVLNQVGLPICVVDCGSVKAYDREYGPYGQTSCQT